MAGGTPTDKKPEHPRLRGENVMDALKALAEPGAPPPARGERRGRRGSSGFVRSTPACAGRTLPGLRTARAMAEHPRLRGEN